MINNQFTNNFQSSIFKRIRLIINSFCHSLKIDSCKLIVALLLIIVSVPHDSFGTTLSKPANNLGLVGYWSFNEGTSTKAYDYSGNNNTGTLTNIANPATATSGWGTGKLGGGLNFDGGNDYVSIPSSSSLYTSQGSLSIWVKPTDFSQVQTLFSSAVSTYNVFQTGILTSGKVYVQGYSDPTNNSMQTAAPITLGQWSHIVITGDASTWHIYVNGVDQSLTSVVGTNSGVWTSYANNGALQIGNLSPYGYYMKGALDEPRVYNRALSAAQVTSLYNTGLERLNKGPSNNGLVGYWSFNEGTSTKAFDYSGNGNTGTLTNMSAPATATSGWGNGKLGGGLNFDGVDDYVDTGDNTALNFGTGDFTVSAWVYNTSQNTRDQFLGKDTTTGGRQFSCGLNGNSVGGISAGVISCAIFSASTPVYAGVITSAGALSPNVWHQIVFERVSGTLYLFLDGVSLSVTTTGNTAASLSVQDTTGPMQIGARQYPGSQDYFAGKIDEVRIYNRALSITEIKNLYTAGAKKLSASQNITGTSLDSGLVGLWSFDGRDISGTTAYDRSGQGNNGTLTNGPVTTIGKMGQALSFDGVDDGVYTSKPTFTSAGMTISMWIKPTSSFGINDNFIGVWATTGWLFRTGNTVAQHIEFYDGTTTYETSGSYIVPGVWQYVTVTLDNSGVYRIYYNGSVVYTSSAGRPVPNTGSNPNMSIGRLPATTSYSFPGSIDDVRIYNRALSAKEVQLLYNMGK